MKFIASQHPSDVFCPVKYCWKQAGDLVLKSDKLGGESDTHGEHIDFCPVCFMTKSSNRLKLFWEIQQEKEIHSSTTLYNTLK